MSYSSLILSESSLVSYWKLDELSGTTGTDSKGANNGTYTSLAILGQIGAVGSGTSVYFYSGNYLNIGAPTTTLPTTGSYSLEAWVKVMAGTTIDSSTNVLAVMGYGSGSTTNHYNVMDLAGNTIVRNWWWGNDCSWDMPDCRDSLWHHYVATFDGTISKMYVDTVQLSLNAGTNALANRTGANFSSSNLSIGAEPNSLGGTLPSKYIDEVAIYNAALTSTQIQDHYNTGYTPIKTNNYTIHRRSRLL